MRLTAIGPTFTSEVGAVVKGFAAVSFGSVLSVSACTALDSAIKLSVLFSSLRQSVVAIAPIIAGECRRIRVAAVEEFPDWIDLIALGVLFVQVAVHGALFRRLPRRSPQ